jgi:hypothetical protein
MTAFSISPQKAAASFVLIGAAAIKVERFNWLAPWASYRTTAVGI